MDIVKGILEGIASAIVVGISLWLWHRGKKYLENQNRLEQRIDVLETVSAQESKRHDAQRKMIEAAHAEIAALRQEITDFSARVDAQALAQAPAGERMEQYLKEAAQ